MNPVNPTEIRATICLALVFSTRLLGLFMIYPVFTHYAQALRGASPVMIGLALGVYGMAQGLLQIPLGLLSDRIGRKTVIAAGLILFAAGSVVAAMATSIDGVVLGRLLQGAGAVGSSILALAADLTREEVRTRAMAAIGLTIGLSFGVAILIGPPLAAIAGLSGIFWFTALLAAVGVGLTLGLTPTPVRSSRQVGTALASFGKVLRDRQLLRLDFAIFSLHAILTASFLVIPRILADNFHLASSGQWKLYLPVLVISVALMVPAIIVAETRGQMKPVFVGAVVVLGLSLLTLAFPGGGALAAAAALAAFLTAFNVMEAMLPSLVTKLAPPEAKGAATGVYSSSQFFGIFVGGAGGGWILAMAGPGGVLVAAVVLTLAWFAVALTMQPPKRRAH